MSFPGPDASRAEIDAFYARSGATQPSTKVWHDFAGKNCDGPCRGWDGVSRRCDCGNRRVYWDEHEDGTRYAAAD